MTYRIIGADHAVYGPVTPEELCQWIADDRADGGTMVAVGDSKDWKPLSEYSEFAAALASAPPRGAAPRKAPVQGDSALTVPTYLLPSIVCTLCVCPVGGVAIYHATQVGRMLNDGDYDGAIAASKKAKAWCWVAFALGLLGYIICFRTAQAMLGAIRSPNAFSAVGSI